MGVAGVAGMSDIGRNWKERVRFSIEVFNEASWEGISRTEELQEVQTLDECLLIVPRSVFARLQFDEKVFDGWDCYGADYCLSVKKLELKSYVIPGRCGHSTMRASYQIWEFKELLKYQKRLYIKHKNNYRLIYAWMGEISWLKLRLRGLLQLLGPVYLRLFPSLPVILRKELSGCSTLLDLGCGHLSPVYRCSIPFSVGVELFAPYLEESKRRGIHTQYVKADIRKLEFKPRSFDAVVAIEVLEHLTREEGADLLGKMEQWAREKIMITTPNGYTPQDIYHKNLLQEHRSGWSASDLRGLGFKVRGIDGWKGLRGYSAAMRYEPAFFWLRISEITQKITWYFTGLAFRLVATKQIKHNDE